MIFTDLQQTTKDLIAASGQFATGSVLIDYGTAKSDIENSISEEANGYSVSVWPITRGTSSEGQGSGIIGMYATIIVRLDLNPVKLKALQVEFDADNAVPKTKPTPLAWMNGKVLAIKEALLGAEPDAGGVKYEPAQDFFELVNFDEGLLSYHLRFNHFVVL